MPGPSTSSSASSPKPPETAPPVERGHFVYVLRCGDGSLYTGYTTDVARRLAVHREGKGARYTRSRRPLALVAWWGFASKEAAMREEWNFKRLTRGEKLSRLG